MRRAIGVSMVACAIAGAPRIGRADIDNPFPESVVVSPGIKLGYTFGAGGGLTYGAEVTVLWRTGPDLSAIVAQGPALELGRSRANFQLRLGWEAVSWFAGVEGGLALVRDADGNHLGVAVSPWIGAIVVPYYEHTFVVGGRSTSEAGAYLKLPLCTGCGGAGGDSWDWDDHD